LCVAHHSAACDRGDRRHHSALNETVFRLDEGVLKQSRCTLGVTNSHKEGSMRNLIFSAVLLAVAAVGFHALISASIAASRDARAATFSERFAPALASAAAR